MTELERAADAYARKHSGLGPKDQRYGRYHRSFLSGAAWQAEQYERGVAKLQAEIDKLTTELRAIAGVSNQDSGAKDA